jgi:hypothetical protein
LEHRSLSTGRTRFRFAAAVIGARSAIGVAAPENFDYRCPEVDGFLISLEPGALLKTSESKYELCIL